MKNGLGLALILLSIIYTITPSYAQRFRTIGVQDGLSDGFVRDIECDSEGYMWFATLDGLNRYDGYHFKKYTLSDLGHNSDVFDNVMEDGAGHLWVKSPNEPFLYDRLTDRLTNDFTPALVDAGIDSDSVSNVLVDEERNI